MKQSESNYVARKFENLSNLFYLMVGLPLLAFTWVYLNLKTISPWRYFEDPTAEIFLHAVILSAATFFVGAAFLQYRRRLSALEGAEDVPKAESLEEKTERFVQASLRKYLMLTAGTVLVVLGFYLSTAEFYVPVYTVLLVIFSITRPTPEKMGKDMGMKKEERKALKVAARQRGEGS